MRRREHLLYMQHIDLLTRLWKRGWGGRGEVRGEEVIQHRMLIVHARGAIPNEVGPTRCRATPASTSQPTRPRGEEEEEEEEVIWHLAFGIWMDGQRDMSRSCGGVVCVWNC